MAPKTPDLAAIRGLRPDLVLANKEENRCLDVAHLEAEGIPTWVTDIRTGPSVAVPIWRDPWMVVGSNTFTGDLLAQLGCRNVCRASRERYPHVDVEKIRESGADVVLLPDEPYRFTADDGPEALAAMSSGFVESRLLPWYGPPWQSPVQRSWAPSHADPLDRRDEHHRRYFYLEVALIVGRPSM